MKKLAPVAVFAFNRADHFAATLTALSENELASATAVYVFLDGARDDADREIQNRILAFLKSGIENKFLSLEVVSAAQNQGLARSIISGVTRVVQTFGRVIVLEDDLVTSPYFLPYMNSALDHYEREEKVISIHGYVKPTYTGNSPFFLKGADCWGWATWARAWAHFEEDGKKLLAEIHSRKKEREFNYENTYDYVGMLKNQTLGKNNSWAVRWYASAFLKDKLTLYPPRSLVQNIGFDGSGEHCSPTRVYDVSLTREPMLNFPEELEVSAEGYRAYCEFNASIKIGLGRRIINKLRRILLHE